jgi:hypothetical protein
VPPIIVEELLDDQVQFGAETIDLDTEGRHLHVESMDVVRQFAHLYFVPPPRDGELSTE